MKPSTDRIEREAVAFLEGVLERGNRTSAKAQS